ncbi:YjjG family noncanonical pyrimidine nucleotidase [Moheibacter sp.]|uniref:YjjG family noncanonical pyrimidine nucleotidase n=1 Tax=Moheibacter sp. TaxID=1965316 RepID=UPI003C72D50A
MENIKHIFFDLDNTLWDYRRNAKITLVKLYEEFQIKDTYGYSFEEFYPHYYESNEQLWADYRDGKLTKEQLRARRFPEAFANMGIPTADFAMEYEQRFVDEVTTSNYVVEGTEEILKYLHGKYQLHILSNGFEEVTHQKINGCLIKDYMETITTAEEAGAPKPDAKAFLTAIGKSDARIENSVYIGDDWIADMVGAHRLGMQAIFFNPLNENHMWVEEIPVIHKLTELKNHL